jgi:hypothetical protein
MTPIIVQVIFAVLSFVCALVVLRSIRSPRPRTWKQIMDRITLGNDHLEMLSHGCIYSEGLDCPLEYLWNTIGRFGGLVSVYHNLGVLIGAIDFLESNYANVPILSKKFAELRSRSSRARLFAGITLARQSMRFCLGDSAALLEKTGDYYFSLIAHLSITIHDHCPELMPEYLHAMSHV